MYIYIYNYIIIIAFVFYYRLKNQFKSQEEDRNFLIKQLVAVKKDNSRLRAEYNAVDARNNTLQEEVLQLYCTLLYAIYIMLRVHSDIIMCTALYPLLFYFSFFNYISLNYILHIP